MTIAEIYRAMRDRGLTTDKASFSEKWLGRTPEHFGHHYNRVSLATKVRLYARLAETEHKDLSKAAHALIIEAARA